MPLCVGISERACCSSLVHCVDRLHDLVSLATGSFTLYGLHKMVATGWMGVFRSLFTALWTLPKPCEVEAGCDYVCVCCALVGFVYFVILYNFRV